MCQLQYIVGERDADRQKAKQGKRKLDKHAHKKDKYAPLVLCDPS